MYRRIRDRRLAAAELLELVFSSRFIGAVRSHLVLGPYALLSNREEPRKNAEELRDEWLRLLGMDDIAVKKSDGAVSANLARRGTVRAHMATVDTSTLCGGCLAYANVATVRKPRKLAPPPADSCHDADVCRDVELCFNCMGQHLIKDCKANISTCPIKGCGERHHVEAHKFISFRRTRRKLYMAPATCIQ